MARPVTRKAHNNCAGCGGDMKEVVYIRPFAKYCLRCKSGAWTANAEVKQEHLKIKERNSKMTNEELGMDEKFDDDPRAKIRDENDVGRVYTQATTFSNSKTQLEGNHHV